MTDEETNLISAKTISRFMAQAAIAFEPTDAVEAARDQFGGEIHRIDGKPVILINLDKWHYIWAESTETRLYEVPAFMAPGTMLEAIATTTSTRVRVLATIPNTIE